MTDLNDRRTSQAVIDAARTIVDRAIDRRVPQIRIGVVFGAPDKVARKCDVRLAGSTDVSPGFVYGPLAPKDGDLVRVIITSTGDRFVDEVLGGAGTFPTATVDGTLTVGGVIRSGGTTFPTDAIAGDRRFRTDLGLGFFFDGTRWLSEELFTATLSPDPTTAMPLTATTSSAFRGVVAVAGPVWVVNSVVGFFVAAGATALSATHKWVGTSITDLIAGVGTHNVDSGASGVWRQSVSPVNIVVNAIELDTTWTKTGTPGNLYAVQAITYRTIAT